VDIRMAQSRGTFVGTTVGLVLASLGVLVIIAGASIWLALRTESDFAQLLRARAIRTATVDLMSLIQDAETGQRGYLLTHDQSYLVPYTQAVARFDQLFSEFRGTVADSPDLRPATEQLSSLLRLKLAELKMTVDLARNGQFASAMSTVNGDTGKDLMNQARVIFAELLERSDNDLKASIAAQREAIQWLRLVAVGGAIVIVAMAGAAAWIITKYTRDLLDARTELEMLNADLEERVRPRERRDSTVCLYGDARPEVAPRQYHGIYQRARSRPQTAGRVVCEGNRRVRRSRDRGQAGTDYGYARGNRVYPLIDRQDGPAG
jgi:CHASE3 domain sensor protein